MTRQFLSVSLAALLVAGGLATAQAQQGQQPPGSPGMMMQQGQQPSGSPGMMRQAQPGTDAEAADEQGRPAGMRGMERMHRMMHRGMGRDYGMRGRAGRGGMHGMRGQHRMMHAHMMRTLMILMDTDGDGALSLEEVQAVTERFFNAMDADNDGRLTMEEIRAFYAMRGAMPGLEEEAALDDEEDEHHEPQAQ